jgi:hypothetical protein
MTTETHYISKGQFLAQLEEFKLKGLPTNSIIHKEIPGCGATTLELIFERNSIIIEPNLPVILSKAKKMNKNRRQNKVVLAVYESITADDVINYVNQRVGCKKILTTPEGFGKIVDALGETALKDYFLLFDECEKAIQDISYRGRIIDPLELFFSFTNKAFISATPIVPSDPRFVNFKHVFIKPDYGYNHNITVTTTNNIVFQLKRIIDSYHKYGETTDRKFFIFFKSTSRIKNTISGLQLTDYSVYCSETKVKELKRDNLKKVYDRLGDNFSNYNFFTSRFFSAVDFDYKDYNCDPIIIMISDPLAVEHSIIDPATEAIQIIGRFREPEKEDDSKAKVVIKDIYHISNYNSNLTAYNEVEIKGILKDIKGLHSLILSYKPVSIKNYYYAFRKDILKVRQFAYYHENGETNFFMIDNIHHFEQVKGYYKDSIALLVMYKGIKRFNVAENSGYKHFVLSDSDLREVTNHTAITKVNALVSLRVKEIVESESNEEYREFNMNMLRLTYPTQMSTLDKFTLIKAANFNYDINSIEQHKIDIKKKADLTPLKIYVQNNFDSSGHTSKEIKQILKDGLSKIGVDTYSANVATLRLIAELSDRFNLKKDSKGNWEKGYKILRFYDTK